MNQILISEKVYVTPGLKRKKKLFKFEFFLSVFLLCILSSYAIYAEYDRNKSEAVSKELLKSINYGTIEKRIDPVQEKKVNEEEEEAIIIVLNAVFDEEPIEEEELEPEPEVELVAPEQESIVAQNGIEYTVIGEINIPNIDVNYPIILPDNFDDIDALLKISVCKFHGADPNTVGNLCIVGHNYKNSKFFSKISYLDYGDTIEIKDLTGNTVEYEVYDKYIVEPDDVSCTTQLTDGKKEITLITCTNDNKKRFIIKATEVL